MNTLLIENDKNILINQLRNLSDILVYYNVIAEIKIGSTLLPNYKFDILFNNEKNNILTNNENINYNLLNKLNIDFNEVSFNTDERIELSNNDSIKEILIINNKEDLDNFLKKEKKGTLYLNTYSRIKLYYQNNYGRKIYLFDYFFKNAIETKNKICIFKRGIKIKAISLAKRNCFKLKSNYYDNPSIYKTKKL